MKNNLPPILSALTLGLIGLLLVFGPLFHLLGQVHTSANFSVFHYQVRALNRVSLPISGVILIYISIFIYRRRTLAALLSVISCLLLVVYLLLFYPYGRITPPVILLSLFYLTAVAIWHKEFSIRNNLEGIAYYLRRISVIAIVGFIYGLVGFYVFDHSLFKANFSLLMSIKLTLDALTGFSGSIAEPTRIGQLFIDSLGGIGIVIFILLINALFRPLRLRVLSHQHEDVIKAKEIIKKTSTSSEDFFKLWPEDKRYYFSHDNQSFITYKQSGRTMIILGDPTGNPHNFSRLVDQFIDYCNSLGWSVAAINTSKISQKIFEKRGLSSLFIGNEAIVDIEKFTKTTLGNKHFRYVANKATRDGLEVQEWSTLTHEQLAKLKAISDDWLSRSGRREYSFFMGYFDQKYLETSRIFVLLQNKEPVAYVNLIPSFYPSHASIDHLRSHADMSPVGMHFLIMDIIKKLHGEGNKTLNIGLVPLSGLSEGQTKLLPRAALGIIRLLGASYYSFEGLEQFKSKFKPIWEPRFILYTGTIASLIRITRDIQVASAYQLRNDRSIYISTAAGIIALTLGLYIILS